MLDVTGPYRIDYKATKNLIDAGMPVAWLGILGFWCDW
jgi:hypothetical protein